MVGAAGFGFTVTVVLAHPELNCPLLKFRAKYVVVVEGVALMVVPVPTREPPHVPEYQ
jgi:hypothetical protein